MKILLLGGTGAMGAHLVDILSKDKDNFIFVTTRKTYFSNTDNVQFLHKNAMDEDDLCDILKLNDWDCIVDFMVYETEQFNKRIQELLKSCKQYVFYLLLVYMLIQIFRLQKIPNVCWMLLLIKIILKQMNMH